MMIQKTIEWTTSKGQLAVIEIKKIKSVEDEISYADGYNINLGAKTIETLEIEMKVDGKLVGRSSFVPHMITAIGYSNFEELSSKGVYARLGDTFIGEEIYNKIMEAIAMIETEFTTDEEFEVVKAIEIEKETKKKKFLNQKKKVLKENWDMGYVQSVELTVMVIVNLNK